MNLTLAGGCSMTSTVGSAACRGHRFRSHANALLPPSMTVTNDAATPIHVAAIKAKDCHVCPLMAED